MRWWYFDYVSLISIIFHYCCFLIAKSCLTFCNAMDSSHQAPLSMGFPQTRLEWVAISFPKEPLQPRDWTQVSYTAGWFLTTGPLRKPMYHWKLKHYLLFTLMCSVMFNCTDCSLSSSSLLGIFQARILELVAISSSRGFSWPEIKPMSPESPALQAHSLPLEPSGKTEIKFIQLTL